LGTGGPIVSGITTFSNVNYFVPPRGTTAERPSNCPVGSIRFNTDSAHLEYFDGLQWLEMEAFNVEIGQAGALGNRGVFGGGYSVSPNPTMNSLDYITISTLGNALDFGDLTVARGGNSGVSNSTRGIFGAGRFSPTADGYNVLDYITFASTGNALDFGDLSSLNPDPEGCSTSTRGLFAGGYNPVSPSPLSNTIDYITIASTGNSQDFGDITVARRIAYGGASSVRGIWSGGRGITPTAFNIIEYVTIASIGNALDFGDLTVARSNSSGSATSSTRMVMWGGLAPSYNNTMDYITMSSTGNATDFGDTGSGNEGGGGCSSTIRGVFAPGTPSNGNTLEYITIATTGNSQDFGDLNVGRRISGSCSNGHGGL
jgi:hypothetical protein